MTKPSTIFLRGRSSREYCFQVFPTDTRLKAVPGIYIFTKRVFENPHFTRAASHECVAIGTTEDLSTIPSSDSKNSAANYVCVLAVADAGQRDAIEQDLIDANIGGRKTLARL
jgi:hypothetical protein